jgi:hypothetical protein
MLCHRSLGWVCHPPGNSLGPQREAGSGKREARAAPRARAVDPASGKELPVDEKGKQLLDEAISDYQSASEAYRSSALRRP